MWITKLVKLLVGPSLAQQMLNPKLLPVLTCDYLSLILFIIMFYVILWYYVELNWMEISVVLGEKVSFFC